MIRYAIYDPVRNSYSDFSTKKEKLSDFLSQCIRRKKDSLKWATGTKYERRYRKDLEMLQRLEVVKLKVTRIE